MTDSSANNRLRPCLLDRLTDHHPERKLESAQERTVTDAELRDLVRRDLTWLFNTTHMETGIDFEHYPNVKTSVLNFGLPDLTGRMLSSIDTERLRTHVLETIRNYEPRLMRDSITIGVRVGASRSGTGALIIDIKSDLWAEPLPLALYLRTEVDVESGRVAVNEIRPD
jgi:type VI secretion system protein ImpF